MVDTRRAEKNVNFANHNHWRNRQYVAVRVAFEEDEIWREIKQNGGMWSRNKQVWVVPYKVAVHMGMLERIEPGLAEMCGDVDLKKPAYTA